MNKSIFLFLILLSVAFTQSVSEEPSATNETTTKASTSADTTTTAATTESQEKSIVVAHNVSFEEIGTVPLRRKIITPVTERTNNIASRWCPASIIMKASCPTPQPCPEIDSMVCPECPACTNNNNSGDNVNGELLNILRDALINKYTPEQTTRSSSNLRHNTNMNYIGDTERLRHTIKLYRERRSMDDYTLMIEKYKKTVFYNLISKDNEFFAKINDDLSSIAINIKNETYMEPLKNETYILDKRSNIDSKFSQMCQEAVFLLKHDKIMFELIYGYNYKHELVCQLVYRYDVIIPNNKNFAANKIRYNMLVNFRDIFLFKFCDDGKLSLVC